MAEDFLGYGGRLDEEFVHAENKSIKTEPFEKFEVRAAFEKPELFAGAEKLRTALVSRWLPVIKAAFNVVNVRVVGGGRGGVDAY